MIIVINYNKQFLCQSHANIYKNSTMPHALQTLCPINFYKFPYINYLLNFQINQFYSKYICIYSKYICYKRN